MPRAAKNSSNVNIQKPKNDTNIAAKDEPIQQDKDKSNTNMQVSDLKRFKFEQKPHIKIEYDNDSPPKKESKGIWEPPNWQDFLLNLKIMRSNFDAPVDTMGCHMSMDKDAPPEVYRYQCLISLMLSSQTKDQVTFAAMERLRENGLTIDNVLKMSDEKLGQLIYPVGFWKTKVKYIKKTTQILKDQYNGDIPDSVDKLCKLTGVGPKMAHICMKVAWNKITGIGVDTHVHRISNRIGWVKKPTNTPEDTRVALQTWLPFDLWSEVNHLMVGFGQTICLPINPLCHECLNSDICPSSNKGKKSPTKKSPKKESTEVVQPEIKMERHLSPTVEMKTNQNSNLDSENEYFEPKKELVKTLTVSKKHSSKISESKIKPKKEVNQQDESTEQKVTRGKANIKQDVIESKETKSSLKRKSSHEKQTNVVVHKSEEISISTLKKMTRSQANIELQVPEIKEKKFSSKRKGPKNKQINVAVHQSQENSDSAMTKKSKTK